jgi:hypothetical protein
MILARRDARVPGIAAEAKPRNQATRDGAQDPHDRVRSEWLSDQQDQDGPAKVSAKSAVVTARSGVERRLGG